MSWLSRHSTATSLLRHLSSQISVCYRIASPRREPSTNTLQAQPKWGLPDPVRAYRTQRSDGSSLCTGRLSPHREHSDEGRPHRRPSPLLASRFGCSGGISRGAAGEHQHRWRCGGLPARVPVCRVSRGARTHPHRMPLPAYRQMRGRKATFWQPRRWRRRAPKQKCWRPQRSGLLSSPSSANPPANPPHPPMHTVAGSGPLPWAKARSVARPPTSSPTRP